MFEIKKFSDIGKQRIVICDKCEKKHVLVQILPSPSAGCMIDIVSHIVKNEERKKRRINEIREVVEAEGYILVDCTESDKDSIECYGCGCIIRLPSYFWNYDWDNDGGR